MSPSSVYRNSEWLEPEAKLLHKQRRSLIVSLSSVGWCGGGEDDWSILIAITWALSLPISPRITAAALATAPSPLCLLDPINLKSIIKLEFQGTQVFRRHPHHTNEKWKDLLLVLYSPRKAFSQPKATNGLWVSSLKCSQNCSRYRTASI